MTIKTQGPRRGFIARWLMRIQAVQGTLSLLGIAVTAASTLTSALVAIGRPELAPYMIALGLLLTPVYAYVYVEWGILARKNREGADRGTNWVGPTQIIGQVTQAAIMGAAIRAMHEDEDPETAAMEAARRQLHELRDGVDIDELLAHNQRKRE